MLEGINNKMDEIEKSLNRKQEFHRVLEQKQQELKKQRVRRKKLRNTLRKKERKIDRLQSPGVLDLIFRREDIDFQEELGKYDSIKSKYEDCENSIENIKKDIDYYEGQIDSLRSLDSDYEDLIRKRRNLILSKNDDRARELKYCLDKISEKEKEIRNAEEGILACNRALPPLERAIRSMEGARSWGVWDMFGGGFLATAAKHSRINNMRREIRNVEKEIKALNTGLSNISLSSNIDIDIGAFATFADYFFDGPIADIFVQGKIKDSLRRLRNTYDKINEVRDILQTGIEGLNRELCHLRDRADKLERGA